MPNQGVASIFTVHFPARNAQTRLAPSPCFSLTTDALPPSLAPLKCKTKYSPIRSACVRCSRFTIRPSGKLKRFMTNLIIRSRTNAQRKRIRLPLQSGHLRVTAPPGADQTLLPLHLSFCRTTLKNEASGMEARGSVFLALRTVTIDPRSTWIGLRPSSVR